MALGSKLAPPWGVMGMLYMFIVKTSKIFSSELTWTRAMIFGMIHRLVDLYKVCSNYGPGVKIGHTPGLMGFLYMCYSENLKNLLRTHKDK